MARPQYQDGPSPKDCTHLRRMGTYRPTVNLNGNIVVKLKEEFLSNKANKQRLINLLGDKPQLSGCTTIHAAGDADLPQLY